MSLAVLAKSTEFVAKTSSLVQRATSESREQLVSFEREAAMMQTAGSLSRTPKDVLRTNAPKATLLRTVTLNQRGGTFQIDMKGDAGPGAVAMISRAELQRIMQMLHKEAVKASWIDVHPQPVAEEAATKVRH
jgi:hypothetical protein